MSCHFTISPGVRKPATKKKLQVVEEITTLSLAPFTPNVKLCFENVVVGTQSEQKLLIKNPCAHDIQVVITNLPPCDRGVTLSWEHYAIPANSEYFLQIFWSPIKEEAWRHTFLIEDGRRLRKDVAITFKSVYSKKSKVSKLKKQKTTVVSKKVKPSPKKTSPKYQTSCLKKTSSPKYRISNVANIAPINQLIVKRPTSSKNKENRDPTKQQIVFNENELFLSPSSATFDIDKYSNIDIKVDEIRRETYTVHNSNRRTTNLLANANVHNISNDSLESTPNVKNLTSDITINLIPAKATGLGNIKLKFESDSFIFSPEFKGNISNNMPSSDSNNLNLVFLSADQNLRYKNSTIAKELFTLPTSTHDLNNEKPTVSEIANISTETYIKGNLSSETYTKANVSSETYTKDISLDGLTNVDVSPNSTRNQISSKHLSPFFTEISSNINGILNLSPISRGSLATSPQIYLSNEGAHNTNERNAWCPKRTLPYIPEDNEDIVKQENVTRSFKRKSNSVFDISPPKKVFLENSKQFPHHNPTLNWSKKNHFIKPSQHLDLKKFIEKSNIGQNKSSQNMITRNISTPKIRIENPFILTIDPFLTGTLYYNADWKEEQTNSFKKWLNILLTPPAELNSDTEAHPIDVAKIWQESKQKSSTVIAPTKESVSNKYHTNRRLDFLRKTAMNFFRSPDVSNVLSKTLLAVDSNKLVIRPDKNVHIDLILQAQVMSLFFCYNPLWLRIGLETIYGIALPLSSNSDIIGLGNFIMQNFFKDAFLLKKHKSIYSPKYVIDIKKFILKKFLVLVYFLDVSKSRILIAHDPCLFCKNAPVKESREILLTFSRDLLFGIGDITKQLRYMGYIVTHKQKYIHEFDYSVIHLGTDLRDGVRLAKLMEIILMKQGITENLRVPAISLLQKIHNMKLVFDSLVKADFEIIGEIEPKDIVDGHREKTLSFLWQIIYKFQAPRLSNAAVIVQKWWRSLQIVLKRKILWKKHHLREMAATKIQQWYKRQICLRQLNKFILLLNEHLKQKLLEKSAVRIQAFIKMVVQRQKYVRIKSSAILLQRCIRKYLLKHHVILKKQAAVQIQTYMKMRSTRSKYLRVRALIINVQQFYRANIAMKIQRQQYMQLQKAVTFIQRKYRSTRKTRAARERYLNLKQAALSVQTRFRAVQQMKIERLHFLELKHAILVVQQRFRATYLMKVEHKRYKDLKRATNLLQRRFRAKQMGRIERVRFEKLKVVTSVLQNRFRAIKAMQIKYNEFQHLKRITILLQQRFRAKKAMRIQYNKFQNLKQSVIKLQQRFRTEKLMRVEYQRFQKLKTSTIILQRYFRANQIMKTERAEFQTLKNATIRLQRQSRANKAMITQRFQFVNMRNAAVTLQRWFRSYKIMKDERERFAILKKFVIIIQQRFRARIYMKIEYEQFHNLRKAVIVLQAQFRAYHLMKLARTEYEKIKKYIILCQQCFRANRIMKIERSTFCKMKNAAITLQRWYRSYRTMRSDYEKYNNLKKVTVITQKRFKAKRLSRMERLRYLKLRNAAILLQRWYRAKMLMKLELAHYQNIRKSVIVLQTYFRAHQLMKIERTNFENFKKCVILCQRHFRANIAMKSQRTKFINMKNAAIVLQHWFRSYKTMIIERENFVKLRKSTVIIQRRFKANQSMNIERSIFLNVRYATLLLQRHFRANIYMKMEHDRFQSLRKATVILQTHFRAQQIMRIERAKFKELRKSVIFCQRCFRANRAMQIQRSTFYNTKNAAIVLQRWFRSCKSMKIYQEEFIRSRKAVIIVQEHFRAYRLMKIEHAKYSEFKNAAVTLQRRFRARLCMKTEYWKFQNLKKATVILQTRFRARQLMKIEYTKYENLKRYVVLCQQYFKARRSMKIDRIRFLNTKNAAIKIQRWFRSCRTMKIQQQKYNNLRKAVLVLQQRFRANQLMILERNKYKKLKSFILVLQRQFRIRKQAQLEKMEYEKLIKHVTVIQSHIRMIKIRTQFCILKKFVVIVQQRFIANRLMKHERTSFIILKKATIIIQRQFRRFKAIKEDRSKYFALKKLRNNSIIKVQALWRGYKTRNEHPEMRYLREKVRQTSLTALPENTLGERRNRAVWTIYYQDNPKIVHMIRALEDLEFITRRCKNTCLHLSSRLPDSLYELMKSTNRSVLETQVCLLATSILINFYRFPSTSVAVWLPEHLDDIFTVMNHCCDKEDKLFLYLCTLVWFFAHNEEHKKIMCTIADFRKKIDKIKFLVLRKQKMVSKVKYLYVTTTCFSNYSNLPLPSPLPDWGLDYPDRPKTFSNSVHALTCLLDILCV